MMGALDSWAAHLVGHANGKALHKLKLTLKLTVDILVRSCAAYLLLNWSKCVYSFTVCSMGHHCL